MAENWAAAGTASSLASLAAFRLLTMGQEARLEVEPSFMGRLRKSAVNHSLVTLPVVAAVFCLYRWLHLFAREPYWVFIVVVMGGGVLRVVYQAE